MGEPLKNVEAEHSPVITDKMPASEVNPEAEVSTWAHRTTSRAAVSDISHKSVWSCGDWGRGPGSSASYTFQTITGTSSSFESEERGTHTLTQGKRTHHLMSTCAFGKETMVARTGSLTQTLVPDGSGKSLVEVLTGLI